MGENGFFAEYPFLFKFRKDESNKKYYDQSFWAFAPEGTGLEVWSNDDCLNDCGWIEFNNPDMDY